MNPATYTGLALIGLGIAVFVLEGRDLRGFGQMAAWFRMTVLVVGVGILVWSLTAKSNAEQGADDQLPARVESNTS